LPYGKTSVKPFLPFGHGVYLPSGNYSEMDREKLKRIREPRRTLEQLSEDVGISTSQLSRFESGDREPRVGEIEKIAKALGVVPAIFLEGSVVTVNVVGRVGAGAEIHAAIDQSDIFEVETPVPIEDGMVGFEVEGNSMYPRYDAGDILICSRDGVAVESLPQGAEVAVSLEDGRRFIKRLRREDGSWTLESHNSEPIRNAKVIWASKVAHVIRVSEVRRIERVDRLVETFVRKRKAKTKVAKR
jgi:phage repressor protein C with HTH and peptisase S24 domain